MTCEHGLSPATCDRCAIVALTAELAEARAVLREVEWAEGDNFQSVFCPSCLGSRPFLETVSGSMMGGHASDCRLAKALSAGPQ